MPNHFTIHTIALLKNPLLRSSDAVHDAICVNMLVLFSIPHIYDLFNIIVVNQAVRAEIMAEILYTGQESSTKLVSSA